ncbi:type I secretion system permease/ATPase [Hahella ganghwensis]|uniref:type I secretion system permease/ATPase n=1 Tax=Hahella ganghwensis TaxID=286420 RepID=UPI00036325FF|nr:type I secretion system permease/ATPase [Hahella ganghwensis]
MKAATARGAIRQALLLHKSAFRSVGVFSAVINLLMLVPAIYMLQVYDRVLASGNGYTLLMLTLLATGLYMLMGALEWVRSLLVIRIGDQLDYHLSARVYNASFRHQLNGAQTDASQGVNDLNQVRQFMTGSTLFAFFDAPWFPFYLLVIFLFHPWLGSLALAGGMLLLILACVNERWSKNSLQKASEYMASSSQLAASQLRHAETIEAMGLLGQLRQRWQRIHRQSLLHQSDASERSALINAITKTTRTALQSFMLGLGAYLALQGEITPGMMVAGSILVGRMLSPVEQLVSVWRQWANTQIAKRRLQALLDAYPPKSAGLSLAKPKGALRVEGVSVIAPGGKIPSLVNVSFTLGAGEVLGVVGASGSGKSSLLRALVGAWPPRLGNIRLDGADIRQWDKSELGPSIGYLPQDVSLFSGTVGENIARFGDLDTGKIVEAAKLAGVHDLILTLPGGYDTMLAEGGAGLSGGQKQRIALARALYGKPSLVVLDEPNANLDETGEAALANAIRQLKSSGQTVILATHRVGVLAHTDKILALRGGELQSFDSTSKVLSALKGQKAQTGTPPSSQQPSPSTPPDSGNPGVKISYRFGAQTSVPEAQE